jgi:hypothetical protein
VLAARLGFLDIAGKQPKAWFILSHVTQPLFSQLMQPLSQLQDENGSGEFSPPATSCHESWT